MRVWVGYSDGKPDIYTDDRVHVRDVRVLAVYPSRASAAKEYEDVRPMELRQPKRRPAMSMTRDEARQRVRELADHLEHRGRRQDERGIIHAEGNLRDAKALRLLLTPPTCATCQHWRPWDRTATHPLVGDCAETTLRGRLNGRPRDFGCTKHAPRAGAAEEQ